MKLVARRHASSFLILLGLVCSIAWSVRPFEAQAILSPYRVLPLNPVPNGTSNLAFDFYTTIILAPSSRLQFIVANEISLPTAPAPTDASLSVNGVVKTIAATATAASYGYGRAAGTQYLWLTLPSTESIPAGAHIQFLVGRDGGISFTSSGSYSVATNTFTAAGEHLESNASWIIVLPSISISAGVSSTESSSPPPAPSPAPSGGGGLSTGVSAPSVFQGWSPTTTMILPSSTPFEPSATHLRCDVNQDNRVDEQDVALLRVFWGSYPDPSVDCVFDGRVDERDAALLLSSWSPDPVAPLLRPQNAEEVVTAIRLVPKSSVEHLEPGDHVFVQVEMDADKPISLLRGALQYNPRLLALAHISTAEAFPTTWLEPPHVNTPGLVEFIGGVGGGWQGQAGRVALIEFTVLAPGVSRLAFDPEATHFFYLDTASQFAPFRTLEGLTLSVQALTEGEVRACDGTEQCRPVTRVSSPTHPDQNTWYKSRRVEFSWMFPPSNAPSTYAYVIADLVSGQTVMEGTTKGTTLDWDAPHDGIWSFEVRPIGEEGRSIRGQWFVHIDATPPEPFRITMVGLRGPDGREASTMILFATKDAMSGLQDYIIWDAQKTIQTMSGYRLPSEGPETIRVDARDVAGNIQSGAKDVRSQRAVASSIREATAVVVPIALTFSMVWFLSTLLELWWRAAYHRHLFHWH